MIFVRTILLISVKLMLCYLTSIAYKMCIIPLMTGFALTCPRCPQCLCWATLTLHLPASPSGPLPWLPQRTCDAVRNSQASCHTPPAGWRCGQTCLPEKKQQQFNPRFVFTMHHSSLRVHFITANCNFSVLYLLLLIKFYDDDHTKITTVQTWKCFTSVSLIKVIIHNEPEKCLWLRWCNSEVINSYLCFIWHT